MTADGVMRGGKQIHLAQLMEEAVLMCREKDYTVDHVIIVKRLGDALKPPLDWDQVDSWWQQEMLEVRPRRCASAARGI